MSFAHSSAMRCLTIIACSSVIYSNSWAQTAIERCQKDAGDAAISACTEVISQNSRDTQYGFYKRGTLWLQKNRYDQAIADYNEALRLDPQDTAVYLNRGIAWLNKKELDKAIMDFDEAIKINPASEGGYIKRGFTWIEKREYDKSIADFNEAIKINSQNWESYYYRGYAWRLKAEYDRAITDFSEAVKRNPQYANSFANRGYAWIGKRDYDKAFEDYNEAIKLNPNGAASYSSRGRLYYYLGKYEEAASDFLKSYELKDDLYTMLWRYLARKRFNSFAEEELAANSSKLKTREWAYPVLEFYLGRRSLQELNMAASQSTDYMCEALFFIGEWYLLDSKNVAAKNEFESAALSCPKDFLEYEASKIALQKLANIFIEEARTAADKNDVESMNAAFEKVPLSVVPSQAIAAERNRLNEEINRRKIVKLQEEQRVAEEQRRVAEEVLKGKIAQVERERVAAEERMNITLYGLIGAIALLASLGGFMYKNRRKAA